MNRKSKGALAIGAGVVILLGGAGSLALWSDEADIAGSDITTGDFGIDCGTSGAWTDISPTRVGGTAITPGTDLMVPGDVWQYTGECAVTATGKNMMANLSVTGVTGGTPPNHITIDTQVDTGAVNTPVSVSDGDTIDVSVTVTFAENTPGTETTNTAIDVSSMKIRLDQVRP